jgi:hypothetical protein
MTHSIGDLVRYDGSNDGRIGIIVHIIENNIDYQDDEYVVLWLNDGKTIKGYMSDQLIGE